MSKTYKVKVNGSYEFEFTNEELAALDFQQISSSKLHVLKDHRSTIVEMTAGNFAERTYEVKINSYTYEIKIRNDIDLLIEDMGLSLGSSQLINDIKAPMPGLILDVLVKPGDEVKEGEYLLVLEAMKMENSLTAPRDGVIKSLSVQKGETVEKNQLLVEME